MKEVRINMTDIGFGANRLGIGHGYVSLCKMYPEFANKIEYIQHKLYAEDNTYVNKKFYNTVYEASKNVYTKQLEQLNMGFIPILIGGDHSLALGSIKASLEHFKGDLGVIWIDAHADINTFATSPSGNIHGMPIAGLLGINDDKYNNLGNNVRLGMKNIAIFGTRDIDSGEHETLSKYDIKNITYDEIKEKSFEKSLNEIIEYLDGKVNNIHISLDLDSIDPKLIKGVSTPVKEGLDLTQPITIIKRVKEKFNISSIDIVEYNPLNDTDNQTSKYLVSLTDELILLLK